MTSRECVKKAIHFGAPERIPVNFDSNRTPIDGQQYGEDMLWVFATQRPLTADGKNEWGVVYEAAGESFGEPKVFPLSDAETLDGYAFPDFTEDWRYEKMRAQIAENNRAENRYVLGMLPHGIFQHMIDLFSFEGFMINAGCNLALVKETAERLCDSAIACAEKMRACGVDGIITIDDTALQDRLMLSMETFNSVFLPSFARLYDRCHALGLDTFLHSCGYTLDILERLIPAGCDVVNLDQQDNMGLAELSRRFQGRVCFYCPIDIQRTLSFSNAEIVARVDQTVRALGMPQGGFIAKTYPQPRAVGMTDVYLKTMTDAFKAFCWHAQTKV